MLSSIPDPILHRALDGKLARMSTWHSDPRLRSATQTATWAAVSDAQNLIRCFSQSNNLLRSWLQSEAQFAICDPVSYSLLLQVPCSPLLGPRLRIHLRYHLPLLPEPTPTAEFIMLYVMGHWLGQRWTERMFWKKGTTKRQWR